MHDDSTQLRFCRALVDEWIRHGVTAAFISPGSRSTPMSLALNERAELDSFVIIDERSASFAALGYAKASGKPTILSCTSGTAGANYYPAVVEASMSGVPLIVCTADRPLELSNVGAPQAIPQDNLYGQFTKSWDIEPPRMENANSWRSLGSQVAVESITSNRPVHLNLAFAEPFLPVHESLEDAIAPAGRRDNQPWHSVSEQVKSLSSNGLTELSEMVSEARGLLVVGETSEDPERIVELADKLAWPIIASPQARIASNKCFTFDPLFSDTEFAESTNAEVILRIGKPIATKSINTFIAKHSGVLIVAGAGAWSNPSHNPSLVLDTDALCEQLLNGAEFNRSPDGWLEFWENANEKARKTVADTLAATDSDSSAWSGPTIARHVSQNLNEHDLLWVSSSMPIRDLETYGDLQGHRVLSNRGANGIDGVIASAIGASLAGNAVKLIIGDVAITHDLGSLSLLAQLQPDVCIVVVDDQGGHIFDRLPQATQVDKQAFQTLFITDPGRHIKDMALASGVSFTETKSPEDFESSTLNAQTPNIIWFNC